MTPERLAEIESEIGTLSPMTECQRLREVIAYVRELELLVDDVKVGRERVSAERDELLADKAQQREWLLHFMQFWEFWNKCNSYLGHQTGYNYERAWYDCGDWITADEYKSVGVFDKAKEVLGFVSSEHGLCEAIDNAKENE